MVRMVMKKHWRHVIYHAFDRANRECWHRDPASHSLRNKHYVKAFSCCLYCLKLMFQKTTDDVTAKEEKQILKENKPEMQPAAESRQVSVSIMEPIFEFRLSRFA